MGFFSFLLSGGILVGKVCQVISDAFSSPYVDGETGAVIAVGNFSFNGLKFFSSNADGDGVSATRKIYVFNTNTGGAMSVVFPNDEKGGGLAYEIPATEKVDITAQLNSAYPPDRQILVGPERDEADSGEILVKLSVNDMIIGGKSGCVSDFTVSCSADGVRLACAGRDIRALRFLTLRSAMGVALTNFSELAAQKDAQGNFLFPIPLTDQGFQPGDQVSGQFHFSMAGNGPALSRENSAPLCPAEARCFRALGLLR